MDSNYFASGGVGASIVVVIGLIYGMINHKRVRSSCCKRTMEASIDIENTTPPQLKIRDPKTPKATKENTPA